MKPRGPRTWLGVCLAAGLLWAALSCRAAGVEPTVGDAPPSLRIGISESVAGEVNGNDLRAAIKAWAETVFRQTGIRIDAELWIRNREVDAFALNILEFLRVEAYADRALVVDEAEFPDSEEYLLLVHQSSGIRSVADLRGRSLLFYRNTRTCLDKIWLETLLAAAHVGPADAFLGRLESSPKLSRVVLPVFFRQTDACIVTRRGFNTLCELNPQLAKQLRPLAVSPKLLTTFTAFHKDTSPEMRRRFLAAVTELHRSVAGRQALMLFGSTRLVPADVSVLRTCFDLLHIYDGIKGVPPAAGK